MNFLAHIYLSFEDEPLLVGNFIGDFVKGKALLDYPDSIQKGIRLHRTIDEYTDQHPIVLKSKQRLRPTFHHYAPVISDVFFDHFLAALWSNYHATPLIDYTKWAYSVLAANKSLIPPTANNMIKYMTRDNWLYHYGSIEGINKALTGMSHRTPYESKMELGSRALQMDYEAYKQEFIDFFPELISHCKEFLREL